jgi:hypothetical protein
MAPHTDTSPDARRRQLEAYRAMAGKERLRLAAEMSDDTRALARAGIRARHGGEMNDQTLDATLARILLGDELAAAVAADPLTRHR